MKGRPVRDPCPDELYTVSPYSGLQGQPCAICQDGLRVGDVVTWRPWPPDADVGGYVVQLIHARCLQAGDQDTPS